MSTLSLPERIVAIDERLTAARIPHAFGGALALAYYAEPRATIDIDLNVFLPPAEFPSVSDALAPLGLDEQVDMRRLEREGQCRLRWDHTPLDLFFAYDPIHEAMRRDARTVPFGDTTLKILAPEHLAVCKAVFDRPKDWLDIEQMLVCVEHLDIPAIREWLIRLIGEDDERTKRFEALAAST